VNNIDIQAKDSGFVVLVNNEMLMGVFGSMHLWFESEEAARTYVSSIDSQKDNINSALQTLITQLHYDTGNPMHLNKAGVLDAINADSVFRPYPGPEAIEQYAFFEPIRTFLDHLGITWRDFDQSSEYETDEIIPAWLLVNSLSITQQALLLYLMLNTQNLFLAPLGYITGHINKQEFIQSWLCNLGASTNENSKSYKDLEVLLDKLAIKK
jgi:hypothetical protein